MPLHGEHAAGAAMRRRQRRLRSWLRHERMTVAMTLAEMTHHTAPRGPKLARVGEEVVHNPHEARRGLKSPPPGGRPGILPEPLPQRSDRSWRHFSGDGLPQLAMPSLASAASESVDSATLAFLTRAALEERRKEEKKVEMKEKEAQKVKQVELRARVSAATRELDTLLLVPFVRRSDQENDRVDELQKLLVRLQERSALLTAPSKRKKQKKKKKRKRKLPKSSSCLRIRRCGQGFRSRSSLSGAQCSFTLSSGPRCFASWPVCTKRAVTRWAGFCLSRCSSRCVPSCCRLQARDAWHHGRFGPEVQLRRHWWHAWLVLLVTLHLALCFLPCLQARVARHHGRYGPEGFYRHVQGLVCWYLTCPSRCAPLGCLRPKMPVIMAGMDHGTVMWRFTGAGLSQGLLHARWCAMSGVMVQTDSTVAVSTSLLCRIGKFLGCRRGEDSRVPQCSCSRVQTWRTRLRSHSCSSSTLVSVQDRQVSQVQSW